MPEPVIADSFTSPQSVVVASLLVGGAEEVILAAVANEVTVTSREPLAEGVAVALTEVVLPVVVAFCALRELLLLNVSSLSCRNETSLTLV
ncbi:hypothetical protein D3C73_1208490 [compost metagenome]